MTHYNLKSSVPSATVVSRNPKTSSLDEMKLYEGKYFFLENGQEFQLRLFNPLSETIAARISFNGAPSASKLIIRPGEDITIDRFLDNDKKMLFETYDVNANNKAAMDAIVRNGLLSVEFFKEQPIFNTYSGTISVGNTEWDNSIWRPNTTTGTVNFNGYQSTYTMNTSHDISGNNIGGVNYDAPINMASMDTLENSCETSGMYNGVPLSDTKAFHSFDPFGDMAKELNLEDDKMETGRIEEGEKSDQQFQSVYKNFSAYPFHTIEYELKPISEHQKYVPTEIRNYCSSCGYRMRKKSWQYCPKCGTKI